MSFSFESFKVVKRLGRGQGAGNLVGPPLLVLCGFQEFLGMVDTRFLGGVPIVGSYSLLWAGLLKNYGKSHHPDIPPNQLLLQHVYPHKPEDVNGTSYRRFLTRCRMHGKHGCRSCRGTDAAFFCSRTDF